MHVCSNVFLSLLHLHLLIQTACLCSSATSVLCPASSQWNFLYKDTSLWSPINQAADVHGLPCTLCWRVCVWNPKMNTEHLGAPSGEHHRGRVAVKRETQRLREERLWGPYGEGDKQEEDRKKQSSRYTEQGAFSVCHIRTVASGWNLGSFLQRFQSWVQTRSPSLSD